MPSTLETLLQNILLANEALIDRILLALGDDRAVEVEMGERRGTNRCRCAVHGRIIPFVARVLVTVAVLWHAPFGWGSLTEDDNDDIAVTIVTFDAQKPAAHEHTPSVGSSPDLLHDCMPLLFPEVGLNASQSGDGGTFQPVLLATGRSNR
jgi:hypothetical protein